MQVGTKCPAECEIYPGNQRRLHERVYQTRSHKDELDLSQNWREKKKKKRWERRTYTKQRNGKDLDAVAVWEIAYQ